VTPEQFADAAAAAWLNGFGLGLGFSVVMWFMTIVKGGE